MYKNEFCHSESPQKYQFLIKITYIFVLLKLISQLAEYTYTVSLLQNMNK